MKLVLGVLSSLFVIGIQGIAYDWKTPEGCSCSCPATYTGPYPPPSSLQHLRDPWTAAAVGAKPGYPGYNPYDPYTPAWNRAGVIDPYVATNPYDKRWPNQWNAQQWNRTWPYTGVAGAGQWGAGAGQWGVGAGAGAWNRNQPWGAAAYNPNQWNNTWNARQPWNRWNANYPGYAGVQDLRAAVAANDAGTNEVQKTASTTHNPYHYYGLHQKAAGTAASGSQEKK